MAVKDTTLTSTAGLKAEFFERYESAAVHYTRLATRIPSTTKKETYAFLGSVPPMREWGTGRLAKGLFSESCDVENLR